MAITVENLVHAPLARVWQAYTSPDDIVCWNAASDDWHTPHATVDLREGGSFNWRMEARDGSTGFDFGGTYTRLIDQELIEYRFGERKASVTFEDSPQGVRVKVTFDPEDTHPLEIQRNGWQSILDNFKRHVEAGA